MNGLFRALKCATWRAGRVIGITLLMSVGFIFYFMFLNRVPFSVANIITRFPQMLLFVGSFMYLAYGVVDIITYVQYAMSFGSTRKDVFLSSIYMHVLEIAGTELVLLFYFLLVPEKWLMTDGGTIYKMIFLVYLFSAGLSLVMGIFVKRFGKGAYVVIIILSAVLGGIVGGMVAFYGSNELAALIPNVSVIVPLAAGGWYVAMAAIFWMNIRKMEVRV